MYKIKVWFKNDQELILNAIDYLAKDESFLKCEITYPDGTVETLVNGQE